MSSPSRIITDRIDAWLDAPDAAARALVLVDVVLVIVTLAVACAAAWRCFAPVGPISGALTHPFMLAGALGSTVAGLTGRAVAAGQARAPGLRPALVDALAEALGTAPRGDLEVVVHDAVRPDGIRTAVDGQLSSDTLATRIEAALDTRQGADSDSDPLDPAFDAVVAALDRPVVRRRLARWLTRLLVERSELIDGIARPVTRKLLDGSWFDRPFSWGELNKRTRRFLERDKGQAWAEEVVARVLADLAGRAQRAQDVRRVLVPTARDVVQQHIADDLGERLRADGELDRLLDEAARAVADDVRPALLGALGHMVDERAATAAALIEARRMQVVLERAAGDVTRRLRLACFAAGGALGALTLLWG